MKMTIRRRRWGWESRDSRGVRGKLLRGAMGRLQESSCHPDQQEGYESIQNVDQGLQGSPGCTDLLLIASSELKSRSIVLPQVKGS